MLVALAKLHGLLFGLVLWLLKQPLVGLRAAVLTGIAMLGEEARRWAGVLMAGLMVWALCWVILQVARDEPVAMLAVLLMGMGWLAAAFKAAELTMANRLWKVRQRQMFRKLSGEVGEVRERVTDGLAKATKGTPAGRAFKTNREDQAKAEAQAQAAAHRQAEAEAAERRRQDEDEAEARRLEALGPDHDPFAHREGSR